jgi:hypothetical protein
VNERLQVLGTLILHIGWHRTASTSIQQALCESRDRLLQQGVLYPLTGLHVGAHHSIAWGVTGMPIKGWGHLPDFQNLLDQLAEEIRLTCCDNVIISSEDLRLIVNQPADAPSRGRLIQLLALFSEVKVLCCVRHQASELESSYRFLVGWEHGLMTSSFHDFVVRRTFSHDFIYANTERFFCDLRPDLQFVFWSFSEAIASGSILDRFFDVAGLKQTAPMEPRLNVALSREATLAILE